MLGNSLESIKSLTASTLELFLLLPPSINPDQFFFPNASLTFALGFLTIYQIAILIENDESIHEVGKFTEICIIIGAVILFCMALFLDISNYNYINVNYVFSEEVKKIYPPEMLVKPKITPGIIFFLHMLPVVIARYGEGFYIGKKLNNKVIVGLLLLFMILSTAIVFRVVPEIFTIALKWIFSFFGIVYATRCFMVDNRYRIKKIRKKITDYSLMKFNIALGIQAAISYFFITIAEISLILIGTYLVGLYMGIANKKM